MIPLLLQGDSREELASTAEFTTKVAASDESEMEYLEDAQVIKLFL